MSFAKAILDALEKKYDAEIKNINEYKNITSYGLLSISKICPIIKGDKPPKRPTHA